MIKQHSGNRSRMETETQQGPGPGREIRKRKRQVTDPVCPREFLQMWNVEAFQATRLPKWRWPRPNEKKTTVRQEEIILEQISKMMSVSDDTIRELADVCGRSTLFTGAEPKHRATLLEMAKAPVGIDLACVRFQEGQRRMRRENQSIAVATNRHMKYNMMDDFLAIHPDALHEVTVEDDYQVPSPNVVISVQISKCMQTHQQPTKFREMETFHVLGTQPLSALRDKISCSTDAIIPGDYSSLPDVDPNTLDRNGDLYKSSFFFIEDVFYNDSRLDDSKDYSKPIIKWAETHMPDKKFKTEAMDKKLFFDLKIQLGHHYLFMHQGSCEHSVLFTDLRLHTSEDIQDIRQYPNTSVTRLRNRSVCQGCFKFTAKFLVKDSPLIPTDPCYLCKLCFKSLLYKKNGEKVGNFKAYHACDFYAKDTGNT